MSDPRTHIDRDWDRSVCPPEDGSPPVDTDWHLVEESTDCAGLDAFPAEDYLIESITDTECALAASGELFDPAVHLIETVNGGDCEDCACCACPCCKGGGYWSQYTMTVSGAIQRTDCPECDNQNGSWTLTRDADAGECVWDSEDMEEPYLVPCGGGGDDPDVRWAFRLQCFDNGDGTQTWTIFDQSPADNNVWSLTGDRDAFCPCGGTFALTTGGGVGTFDDGSTVCIYGSSVTVSPVPGTWVSCGKPEPDCEGMMAGRMSETPEQKAARLEAIRADATAKDAGGLGDEVEALIRRVGLHKLAKTYERITGRSCGCAGRKALLNKLPGVLPQVRKLLGVKAPPAGPPPSPPRRGGRAGP